MPTIHSRLGAIVSRRRLSLGLVAGLALVGSASPCLAGIRGGTASLDPFLGVYVFNRHEDRYGHYVGMRGGFNFTRHVGAEASLGYFPPLQSTIFYQNADDLAANGYRLGANALFHLVPDGPLVPFLTVGIGNLAVAHPAARRERHFGWFDVGVGLKAFVSRNVALRSDVRRLIFDAEGGTASNLEFSFGLTILIGRDVPRGSNSRASVGESGLQ